MKKQMADSLDHIARTELGKQSIQAKKVYFWGELCVGD